MRIFYLGKFEEEHNTENYIAHALQKAGVEVKCQNSRTTLSLEVTWTLIQKFKPQIVLFSKSPCHFAKELIQVCRINGIKTVCWQFDLFIGYRARRLPQFWSDYLFTTDGGHDAEFKELGCNHYTLRQGIHKPESRLFIKPYKYDLAFVGSDIKSRSALLKFLRQQYNFVHHTNTRGLRLNEALAEVKIVVGDSYPSDGYWSNRIYEILGRGGFLLHPSTVGLDSEFVDGKHYVSYERDNFENLATAIDLFLREDSQREAIRQQGHLLVKENYTYQHRVEELLAAIS